MNEKTPLVRIVKRGGEELSPAKIWMIRVCALALAVVLGGIIILCLGKNPIKAYSVIITSSLGKSLGRRQVLKNMVPLLGTALALAPCFKMKYWNIGAEGQITLGAIGCTYFALFWVNKLPAFAVIMLMVLASALLGGLWASIPAIFKAKWGTNETLFTLMLNYIGIGIARYLQGGPWEGVKGSQLIPQFNKSVQLPKVLGVHCGWIIVFVLVIVMYVYMKYTKHGYEIAVLGDSENTARYAGMDVPKVIIRTSFLSGAIAGLVGFMLAAGTNGTLNADIADGAGFTAITVAWLSQLNPFAMVIIAFLLAILEKGSASLATVMSVPNSISEIITGIILMCMLGCEFFINYKLVFRHHKEKNA